MLKPSVRHNLTDRRHQTTRVVATLVAVMVGLTACSSSQDSENLNTREPATAAISPDAARAPDGTVVVPDLSIDSTTFDDSTRTLAILPSGGDRLLLVGAADSASAPRTVTLPGSGTSVLAGSAGSVLVTTESGVLQIDCATGSVREIDLDGGAISAVPYADGLAVGTATGNINIVDADGRITKTISGLASVDALATDGDALTALDTRQTSVTSIDVAGGNLGPALRAGEGATKLAAATDGRIAVSDTADDELLLFTDDDLILRERFPLAGSPYAVVYDNSSSLLWVTLTASNEVAGFDVSTGIPVEKARFSTVRQPDSVAVDETTGNLYVGSAVGQGVQRIPTRS